MQKQILVHWIYSHKRSDQSFHKSSTSHPLRASVCVKDSGCRALPFSFWFSLGLCCCAPLFRFLAGEVLLNPLGFCWRIIHERKPKPSLRAAGVTSSSVSSFLFPLCTVYKPSFDLRACDPSSTCVSNRTHAPMRSCSPFDGYKHKCFCNSSFPCPSRKRSTTKLSSMFWSASGYACCAKFLIFSANSSADSLRRLVRACSSARCASSSLEGHICATSVFAESCNYPVDPRSFLLDIGNREPQTHFAHGE